MKPRRKDACLLLGCLPWPPRIFRCHRHLSYCPFMQHFVCFNKSHAQLLQTPLVRHSSLLNPRLKCQTRRPSWAGIDGACTASSLSASRASSRVRCKGLGSQGVTFTFTFHLRHIQIQSPSCFGRRMLKVLQLGFEYLRYREAAGPCNTPIPIETHRLRLDRCNHSHKTSVPRTSVR